MNFLKILLRDLMEPWKKKKRKVNLNKEQREELGIWKVKLNMLHPKFI